MPRKAREREREQQRKESKRQRTDVAATPAGAQVAQGAEEAPMPDPAAQRVADEIAVRLGGTEDDPCATILRAVARIGADAALALLADALMVEAGGIRNRQLVINL